MDPITFAVSGEPKSQPRPKAMRRGHFVHIYTPATAKAWKGEVASAATPFLRPDPIVGPLSLTLDFRFKRPKSHLTSKGELTKSAPRAHVSTPDADNLAKAVMDALTDAGLWKDDDQITRLSVSKEYVDHTNPEALGEGVTVHLFQFSP